MSTKDMMVLTAEHASNYVPKHYKPLFGRKTNLFNTQQAFDQGADYLCKQLEMYLGCPMFLGNISRLIIDLNRTIDSRSLFSTFSKKLKPIEKQLIINHYYRPYVNSILLNMQHYQSISYRIVHISIHTCSSHVMSRKGPCDLGIIYDSKRKSEKIFAEMLSRSLQSFDPSIKIKSNYPFKGHSKGLTNYFRLIFQEQRYIGVELQINHELMQSATDKKWIRALLQASLGEIYTEE